MNFVTSSVTDTPQKCHFTLEFCKLNFSIAGCPRGHVRVCIRES